MVANDVVGLAHEYCRRGVSVQLSVYKGDDHTNAAIPFEVAALSFLQRRLLGLPVADGCGSVGVGNALTPVPLPPVLHVRYGGLRHGVAVVYLRTNKGTLSDVVVALTRGRHRLVTRKLASVDTARRRVVLHAARRGRYRISVTWRGLTEATRSVRVRA
jgi:hypothetical protein